MKLQVSCLFLLQFCKWAPEKYHTIYIPYKFPIDRNKARSITNFPLTERKQEVYIYLYIYTHHIYSFFPTLTYHKAKIKVKLNFSKQITQELPLLILICFRCKSFISIIIRNEEKQNQIAFTNIFTSVKTVK